jgi:N-methylhydantoinase B
MNLAGKKPDGTPFATVLFFNGGTGARPTKDGVACLSWPSNISSTPVEVAERDSPVFFRYKRLCPDSGGDGQFRGGLGQDVLIESQADDVAAVFVTERTKFAAPGLGGGNSGGMGDVRINDVVVDNRQDHILRRGDRVLLRTPGGGGYGPRRKRLVALRERDEAMGYVAPVNSPMS